MFFLPVVPTVVAAPPTAFFAAVFVTFFAAAFFAAVFVTFFAAAFFMFFFAAVFMVFLLRSLHLV